MPDLAALVARVLLGPGRCQTSMLATYSSCCRRSTLSSWEYSRLDLLGGGVSLAHHLLNVSARRGGFGKDDISFVAHNVGRHVCGFVYEPPWKSSEYDDQRLKLRRTEVGVVEEEDMIQVDK